MRVVIIFLAIMVVSHVLFLTMSQTMGFYDYWVVGIIWAIGVAALFGYAFYKGWIK